MKLINADLLLRLPIRITGHFDLPNGKSQNFEAIPVKEIENAPAVDAVVRCKDCENYIQGDKDIGFCIDDYNGLVGTNLKPDDFCSYGVRKEQK